MASTIVRWLDAILAARNVRSGGYICVRCRMVEISSGAVRREQQFVDDLEFGIEVEQRLCVGPDWFYRLWPFDLPSIFWRATEIRTRRSYPEEHQNRLAEVLRNLPFVKRLWIRPGYGSWRIGDPSCLQRIEFIEFDDGTVDATTLRTISNNMGELREMELSTEKMTENWNADLKLPGRLESLWISGNAVTDETLHAISELKRSEGA